MRVREAIRRGIIGRRRAVWTPAQISSAVAWWDASQGLTQSGGLVSSWSDRVGSNAATQSTGSFKPAYSATALNGYPGLTFDGSDDLLTLVGVPAAFPTGSSAGWMFALVDQQRAGATAGNACLAGYGGSGASGTRELVRLSVGSQNRLDATDSTVDAVLTADFSGVAAVFGLFGATIVSRMNGTESAGTAATLNTLTTRVRIGSAAGTSWFWNGVIGHVIVGTGALTTGDKEKLEAWALWSVGKQSLLPSNHTYKNAAPTAEVAANDDWEERRGLLVPARRLIVPGFRLAA